jgi:micrococcal nuclease
MATKLALIVSLLLSSVASGDEIKGKVVGIADGDTITVLDESNAQHKIRLEGIDAPEKKQAFGEKSKTTLSEKVFQKDVVVRWEKKDKYGRVLGAVYLDKRHINLEMVQEGLAWHYKRFSKAKELAEAEVTARDTKVGLWAEENPMPPWEFRAKKE